MVALRLVFDCVHQQFNARLYSMVLRRSYCNEKVFKSLLTASQVASPFADPARLASKKAAGLNGAICFSLPLEASAESEQTAQIKSTTVTRSSSEDRVDKDAKENQRPTLQLEKKLSAIEELSLLKDHLGKVEERSESGGTAKAINESFDDEAEKERASQTFWNEILALVGAIVFGSSVIGFVAFCLYYGRAKRDALGNVVPDEWTGSYLAPFYRIANSFKVWRDFVVEPAREKLLPDPLPHPYIQPKYTVVIEMKNVLVHPDWTYKTGYRFAKRPALDYFLDVVGYPNFEVVIYTSESMMTAHPVVDSFDPKQRIMYRLYRDCTKYMHGQHVKDLSKLNRDLSKVIFIDVDAKAAQLNPENMLLVPEWKGNMDDTSLVDLAELLKTIHLSDVEDVRPTLQYYSQFPDPAKEFRRRAIYLAEQEQQKKQQMEEGGRSLLKKYSGRLFGYRRHAPT
ncbi:Mitochondrial import inner membrane translocase subunit TIM50 [Parelaphostrongylus tenuis]|uniref:Mitochondrial import inner membrane translocase subunit TIM50 n=1 Tax=Parelaphostrongylus tenuis TaxID=148309 RepID=A0AAD5RAW0_PARTN|nr:Mitochondrial import inner membrane translocase subunit TIM50 [Parelaphostrongylus tenuis]